MPPLQRKEQVMLRTALFSSVSHAAALACALGEAWQISCTVQSGNQTRSDTTAGKEDDGARSVNGIY